MKVRPRVQDVLTALAAAENAGPKSGEGPVVVRSEVVANLLNRAATQYSVSRDDKNLEPYLDGLGFAIAARREAAKVLPQLKRSHKRKAAAIEAALKVAEQAYPGIRRPEPPKVVPGQFLAAASKAALAVSNWK